MYCPFIHSALTIWLKQKANDCPGQHSDLEGHLIAMAKQVFVI